MFKNNCRFSLLYFILKTIEPKNMKYVRISYYSHLKFTNNVSYIIKQKYYTLHNAHWRATDLTSKNKSTF